MLLPQDSAHERLSSLNLRLAGLRADRSGDSLFLTGGSLTFWLQWLAASVFLVVMLCGLAYVKNGAVGVQYRGLALVVLLASVPAYAVFGVYDKRHGYLSGAARLLAGWLMLLAGLAVAGFVTKTGALFSREVMLQWTVLGFAGQVVLYLPLHHMARRLHRHFSAERTALIVGTGGLAQQLADRLLLLKSEPLIGMVAVGEEWPSAAEHYRVLGEVVRLRELIVEYGIRRLYIALPLAAHDQVHRLYIDLLDSQVDVLWIPDLQSLMLLNHSVSDIGGLPVIHLNESPLTAHPTAALLKAMMDRVLSLFAIVMLSPVLIATALAVKLSSSGPILFRQKRLGWNGQVIQVWKFRSMRVHEDIDVKQATRNDPRVTPVGRFIRRTSIDELPQLFNVLQGQMSLVGPRPHALAHNDYYTGKISAYMARHRVKPGITGLAQISGYRGETDTLEKMAKRVELDLAYINSWSLWLDIKILIKTPFTLFSKNVY